MSSALGPTPPASSAGDSGMRGPSTNSSSRQMRLKVSYSFDDGDKSNCLARWPHLVNTPVVQVDRDLLVGAVEFKTCVLSIIAGSPELVARLGPDYSIYAYDYSEPDIPLVGCGMLSWAMLNTEGSSTRMMVTGRVNPNAFVFLSNDEARETLEVKIRLRKVDTFTQEQFVNSVHAYQALSRTLPGEFDASTWSSFLNANPRVLTAALPAPPLLPPPPPLSATALASQTAVELTRRAPSLAWKENSASSSEDVIEPPKKKQKRPTKTKKKPESGKSVSTTPIINPISDPGRQATKRQSLASRPSRSRESSTQPSISRQSSTTDTVVPPEISPSPQISVMASSPPTQPEVSDSTSDPSPAPTSPCLPSLPPPSLPKRGDTGSGRVLETLFEEAEPLRVKEEPQSDCIPQSGGLLLPSAPARKALALPDDATLSAALSLEPSQFVKLPNKRRTSTRNKASFTSDAIASSELGDDARPVKHSSSIGAKIVVGTKTINKSRTAAHVKTRIEMQLMEALKRGEMPNYCRNCGAIETGVWRKVKAPPDGSEEPVKVDEKFNRGRFLKEKEKEVLLCNACGLWFIAHKTMRPQQLWEANKEEKVKNPNPRKRKKSAPAPTPPASSLSRQTPEPCTEPIVLADEDDTARAASSIIQRVAMTPSANRSVAKDKDVEWKAAIDANRRVACSSPVIHGSVNSPIDLDAVVDGMPSPKRVLFPEARKSSPEKPVGHPMPKRASGKENNVPDLQPTPGNEITCPVTPTKRATSFQFLTPMRSASKIMHQSSPCRSSKRTPRVGVPATPDRRLMKSPQQRQSMSPVAGLLEKLLAEDPSVLADISELTSLNAELAFDMDDDFLNTDYTMPSSPLPSSPPIGFNLYENPEGMSTADWSDFLPDTPTGNNSINMDDLFDGKEGVNSLTVDLSAYIEDHTTSGGIVESYDELQDKES